MSCLPVEVNEKSYAVFQVVFKDENDTAITPTSINWSLTNDSGDIINGRNNVSFGVPASTINILTTGVDNTIVDGDKTRVLTVEALVDTGLGNDLSITQELKYTIKDLVKIT